MEKRLNQISVDITNDRTNELMISKIDLRYAYGQMRLSEKSSRQCAYAMNGGNFYRTPPIQKGILRAGRRPCNTPRRIDPTLE